MRYKKNPDRLYIFVTLSLILHVIVFLIFPYGDLKVLGNNGDSQEYGFLQIVEYKVERPANNQEENMNSKVITDREENTPKKEDVQEENTPKEEPKEEDIQKNTPQEEVIQEENTPKEELVQEQERKEVEKITEETETKEALNETRKENNRPEKVSNNVITSEQSDIEVEVTDDESNQQENIEGESQVERIKESSVDEVDVEEIQEPAPLPPPPPTAGDLIIGAPLVAYPKDLVGQAISGKVELQVHVASNGIIEGLQIIDSSGIEQMDRIAKLTIENGWQFKKYQQAYSMVILVEFDIDENGNPNVKVSQGNLEFK